MKKAILRCLLLVYAILFVFSTIAYAAPVGKITRLEGKVDVLKSGQQTVAGVSLGDNVDVGDIFRAKTNSRAEITFLNKNILRIHPATRVQISQYSDDGTRSNQIMKMDRGKVEAVSSRDFVKQVSSLLEGNKFEVHTPNAVAGIRGSGMTVGFAQMVTGLFFSTGRGYFYNPNQPGIVRNVSAGFVSFVVGTGGLPSRPVPGNVSYVGGGTGTAPGSGGTTGSGLGTGYNIQTTGFINPINQTYTFTPPPTIPNVTVGSVAAMTGLYNVGSEIINISVNNVKFYGPSITGQPSSWKADNVTGTYENLVGATSNFGGMRLTGGGMTANFVLTSDIDTGISSGNWAGNIASGDAPYGVGAYTQAFTFSGTASGTWSGGVAGSQERGTISGNASGVVPGVLTQEPISNPSIYVGSVPYLLGGIGNSETGVTISFNTVKFYGPSVSAQPQTWQAESVTGNYRNFHNGEAGFGFIASGSGISAYVKVPGIETSSTSGAWSANISNGNAPTGVGSYTQGMSFSGTASGTFGGAVAGTGSISGTASGVVPSVLTQDPIVTPIVQVGIIPSLVGSIGFADYMEVNMQNVKFWGPSTTAQPHTWTSANITGNYGGNPANFIGQTFTMTSLNPVANSKMTVNSFSGGSWTGTVSNGNAPLGVGAFTQPVGFAGKSTGTYSGSTLSGTASGKAYQGVPPS